MTPPTALEVMWCLSSPTASGHLSVRPIRLNIRLAGRGSGWTARGHDQGQCPSRSGDATGRCAPLALAPRSARLDGA